MIKRGDIWYITIGSNNIGSEQRAGRPAIVVSNDKNNMYSRVMEIVYLTSQPKQDLPTHVKIKSAPKESVALCEQINSVSVERMTSYAGSVTPEEMEQIDKALLISLAIRTVEEKQEEKQIDNSTDNFAEKYTKLSVEYEMLLRKYNVLSNLFVEKEVQSGETRFMQQSGTKLYANLG